MKVILLVCVWIPSTVSVVMNFKPEVPLTPDLLIVRTATTITLSKPICLFPNETVDVFGVQASVFPLPAEIGSMIRSYQQTDGGATGPYRAASFATSTCTSLPFMLSTDPARVQAEIDKYLFRVGNDVQCLNQVNNPPENCNAPLRANATYRFKFAVRNTSTNVTENETLWSDPISLLRVFEPTGLNPSPGGRTGGMVVITTILSILLFLLLCAFATILIYKFWGSKELATLEQQPGPRSYTTHVRNQDYAESIYSKASKPPQQQQQQQLTDQQRYQSTIAPAEASE
ncbi:uroplakin-3a-like [Hemiscyllium ocellatum]|uniref:uroplakin-3a-like n=1 Tax=Hemiscyllium ocellatum TaxID=170820 RepID=UPI002965E3AE|nr:uroplakin-3a-like [Hemiscyllium ocellatum]